MKLATWNVNGIRAAHRGGFAKWFKQNELDVVCLQEVKATLDDLTPAQRNPGKHHAWWHSAEKKGYSGVAIISKTEPNQVQVGFGEPKFDCEGRVLIAEFPSFTILSAYFPNSQRDHARLPYKLAFCKRMFAECSERTARGQNVIVCGDFNIAHEERDLANPKSNRDNAGFLPQERAWMTKFLASGFRDAFREFVQENGHYTFWNQRPGVREKNVGWRLDSFVCSESLTDRLKGVEHQTQVRGSDHCPVVLELKD